MANLTRGNTRPGTPERSAVYRREYERRMAKADIPYEYRAGHGNMPASIVRKVENDEALTRTEERRYGKRIERYKVRFGQPGTGNFRRQQRVAGPFSDEEAAEVWITFSVIPPGYLVPVRMGNGTWEVQRIESRRRPTPKVKHPPSGEPNPDLLPEPLPRRRPLKPGEKLYERRQAEKKAVARRKTRRKR